jgi:hypothetical protein
MFLPDNLRTALAMTWLRSAAIVSLFSLTACGDGGRLATEPVVPPAETTGTLVFNLAGLPSGRNAAVEITGPGGFARTLTASQTLTGLVPGVYSVTVHPVTVDGLEYAPAQAVRFLEVGAGASVPLAVEYRGFNLQVENFYITQSIQKYDGSIPLVAGRDGFLRVFVTANNANRAAPSVRVEVFHAGTPVFSRLVTAPTFAVPTQTAEEVLTSTWNVMLDGALIQPGMSVRVEVDPDGEVKESDDNDNVFPRSRTPRPLDVRTVPALRLVLVPLLQPNGRLGNVTEANKAAYMTDLLRMFPIGEWSVTVREPYHTSTTLRPNDGWIAVLSELESIRASESRPGIYYYGVGTIDYTAGIYGIAYRPGWTGLGNDYLDTRNLNASMTLAHEVGHSMNRPHSQCGSAGFPDIQYPHANGQIGSFGLDLTSLRQYLPVAKDLMGYCEDRWIGDHTYEQVLNHRVTVEHAARAAAQPQPSLMVWGRIEAGKVVLEPAFETEAYPSPQAQAGTYRVEGFDEAGRTLFAVPLDARPVEHAGPGDRVFAMALPLAMTQHDRLAGLRVMSGGREVARRSAAVSLQSRTDVRRRVETGSGRRLVRWDDGSFPLAVIRDPTSGRILALGRNGVADVGRVPGPVEVILSDGVRSRAPTLVH